MTQPTKQFGRRQTLLVAVLALAALTAFSVVAAGYAAPNSAASPAAAQYRPSCLVSNTRTGSGSRSLQAGIDAAAGGDTLVVKGTCFGNATIDKDLTLKGVTNPAFGTATLNGGGGGSVLTINSVTATIANLSITNGAAGGGGGIRNSGTTTLIDSTVSGNTASVVGGGILNNSGSLTLTNSTVSGNVATAQSGGGIYNNPGATVTLSDSTVSGNIAGIAGGGILNNLGTVTLTSSTVSGNTAGSFGGGIWNFGSLTLTDSTVSGNTAGTNGGGIYSPSGGVTLAGTNALVNNNPNNCVGC